MEYDAGKKDRYCDTCGQYGDVIAPVINLDKINEPLKDGFYQSNLWFASRNEKSPVFITSPETKTKLDKKVIKNICFNKIVKKSVC